MFTPALQLDIRVEFFDLKPLRWTNKTVSL